MLWESRSTDPRTKLQKRKRGFGPKTLPPNPLQWGPTIELCTTILEHFDEVASLLRITLFFVFFLVLAKVCDYRPSTNRDHMMNNKILVCHMCAVGGPLQFLLSPTSNEYRPPPSMSIRFHFSLKFSVRRAASWSWNHSVRIQHQSHIRGQHGELYVIIVYVHVKTLSPFMRRLQSNRFIRIARSWTKTRVGWASFYCRAAKCSH